MSDTVRLYLASTSPARLATLRAVGIEPEPIPSHVDEEAAVYAIIQLGNGKVVTKYMSEIVFVSSAREGDIVEIGLVATRFGRTSLTMRAEARNLFTHRSILTIDEVVFVNLDQDGNPAPHGYTDITYARDRVPATHRA